MNKSYGYFLRTEENIIPTNSKLNEGFPPEFFYKFLMLAVEFGWDRIEGKNYFPQLDSTKITIEEDDALNLSKAVFKGRNYIQNFELKGSDYKKDLKEQILKNTDEYQEFILFMEIILRCPEEFHVVYAPPPIFEIVKNPELNEFHASHKTLNNNLKIARDKRAVDDNFRSNFFMKDYCFVTWPHSKEIMEHPRFEECFLVPITDEKDLLWGSLFVPKDLCDELIKNHEKFRRADSYYYAY